jgi:hypothetical protein
MSYTTKTKALAQVPKMLAATTVDLDWDNAVIPFCDNYIDNKLREFYEVPFSTTADQADEPSILQAANMLYAGHAINIRYTEDDPTRVANNFFWKEGRKMIQQIRAGIIKLDLEKVTKITNVDDLHAQDNVDSTTQDLRPIFNEGNELQWEDICYDENTHERVNPEDY